MPLFSRKPSREAGLQKIYTEAYQSSLQSILKESSFEYSSSLDSWKQTLAQITSGMALLDGSPPKTGQEKSLLASIMDIERQCHDRISALEIRLHNANVTGSGEGKLISQSPYGTSVTNPSSSSIASLSISEKRRPSRVAVGTKGSTPNQAQSEPVLSNHDHSYAHNAATSTNSPMQQQQKHQAQAQATTPTSSATNSPVFDFSNKFVSNIPKVNEMPYKLYSKKPAVSPVQSPPPSTRSAPVLASEKAIPKKKESAQQPQQRSSLDYPQPAPAHHSHSMLTTLRSKNPLKNRSRSGNSSNVSGTSGSLHTQKQQTPSPRNSAESVALTAAKQTVAAAAAAKPGSPDLQQFSGFEGAFISDSTPTSPNISSPAESHGNNVFPSNQSPTSAAVNLTEQNYAAQQQTQQAILQQQSQPAQQAQPTQQKKTQFQVAYEKVPTATGRIIYRPRVIRTPVGPPSHQAAPAASTAPQTQSLASQPRQRSPPNKVLADGKGESRNDKKDLDEMDDWDRMAHEKIKDLRGVDKNAAEQIMNEVVLKGDKVNWDDIAGLEKAKASLKETVVYPFLRPDLFMGLREPVLGMLLFGPPGTGKTMLARAVATESNSTFFSISASSLTSKYMGESEKLVRALFQMAKALAPSIIFVDEIDSILTQRADSGEHEASRRIKNEFLVQWSDLQAAAAGKSNPNAEVKRVLVLGATNLPWAIDEAARRRFVRRQYIPLPEPFTRRVHLEKLLSHQKHAITSDELTKLTEITEGYSGSDLTALAKDAAMGPLRSLGDALLTTAPDQIRPMGMADFIESMKSIRPSVSVEGLRAFEQWADMYGSSGA